MDFCAETLGSLSSTSQKILRFINNVSIIDAHQAQFSKNRNLLKAKYLHLINPVLSSEELKRHLSNLENESKEEEDNRSKETSNIHVFLGLLAVYEAMCGKSHLFFTDDEWYDFSQNVFLSSKDEIESICSQIFKNNWKNYSWTSDEDGLLCHLIRNKPKKWKQIASLFNKSQLISQMRSAGQCKERWENHLSKNFRRGKWECEEDIKILVHVKENGTSWAKLARSLVNRTEHAVKNRFFGLLSSYIMVPIRTIKETINYRNTYLLSDTLNFYENLSKQQKDATLDHMYRFFEKEDILCFNSLQQSPFQP